MYGAEGRAREKMLRLGLSQGDGTVRSSKVLSEPPSAADFVLFARLGDFATGGVVSTPLEDLMLAHAFIASCASASAGAGLVRSKRERLAAALL